MSTSRLPNFIQFCYKASDLGLVLGDLGTAACKIINNAFTRASVMIGNNTPPAGTVEADLSNRGGEALAMAEADVLECEGIAGLIKALRASGQDIQFEGGRYNKAQAGFNLVTGKVVDCIGSIYLLNL